LPFVILDILFSPEILPCGSGVGNKSGIPIIILFPNTPIRNSNDHSRVYIVGTNSARACENGRAFCLVALRLATQDQNVDAGATRMSEGITGRLERKAMELAIGVIFALLGAFSGWVLLAVISQERQQSAADRWQCVQDRIQQRDEAAGQYLQARMREFYQREHSPEEPWLS
jgi:hypothetical protein